MRSHRVRSSLPPFLSPSLSLVASLLAGGCAADGVSHADPHELAADLERELAARSQSVAAARASSDPWDLWLACVETSSPDVIAARRDLAMAEARARVAGAPTNMLELESVGGGADRETELMLALDLPGLLGAGRNGAMKARAEVDTERARAQLAAARFRARHELERRLAALIVARQLEADVASLEASSSTNAKRLELLRARGWLAPDAAASAETMIHHLGVMRAEQQAAVAAARAGVALATGLPSDSPFLDDATNDGATSLLMITQRTWGRGARPDPDSAALLEAQPDVVLARLDYVAAEADLRIACAERWPAIWIGPKAMWTADDLLLGGLLRLELPWSPSAGAAVDAARAGREKSRDALVSALAAARSRIAQRRVEQQSAERALREHADDVLVSSEASLRAAQARFAVDPGALVEWGMALDQRVRALTTHANELQRWLVATFDLSEALGPEARR